MSKEYNCVLVEVKDQTGRSFKAIYDKSRELLFTTAVTMEFAKHRKWKIEEIGEKEE